MKKMITLVSIGFMLLVACGKKEGVSSGQTALSATSSKAATTKESSSSKSVSKAPASKESGPAPSASEVETTSAQFPDEVVKQFLKRHAITVSSSINLKMNTLASYYDVNSQIYKDISQAVGDPNLGTSYLVDYDTKKIVRKGDRIIADTYSVTNYTYKDGTKEDGVSYQFQYTLTVQNGELKIIDRKLLGAENLTESSKKDLDLHAIASGDYSSLNGYWEFQIPLVRPEVSNKLGVGMHAYSKPPISNIKDAINSKRVLVEEKDGYLKISGNQYLVDQYFIIAPKGVTVYHNPYGEESSDVNQDRIFVFNTTQKAKFTYYRK